MEWFTDRFTVVAQSHQSLLSQNDLQKAFRVLLQSCTPSALGFTKLDSTFLALLGGELRHGLNHHNRPKNQVERSFIDSQLKMLDREFLSNSGDQKARRRGVLIPLTFGRHQPRRFSCCLCNFLLS
jgi:hypothetical protein